MDAGEVIVAVQLGGTEMIRLREKPSTAHRTAGSSLWKEDKLDQKSEDDRSPRINRKLYDG